MRSHHFRSYLIIGDEYGLHRGTQGDPEVGRKAAEDAAEELSELFRSAHVVFVAAGMGGGTGTGAAPVVARLAKAAGALTIGVVSRPFSFEGAVRREIAEVGIRTLAGHVDTLIDIASDPLLKVNSRDAPPEEAFRAVEGAQRQAIRAVVEPMMSEGLNRLTLTDLRRVMSGGGIACMTMGSGNLRFESIKRAIYIAVTASFMNFTLKGAHSVLLSLSGGEALHQEEINEAEVALKSLADEHSEVVVGAVRDASNSAEVRVTIIAIGTGQPEPGLQARTYSFQSSPDPKAGEASEVVTVHIDYDTWLSEFFTLRLPVLVSEHDTALTVYGTLTPDWLTGNLGPYLRALGELQHVIDELRERPPSDLLITGIVERSYPAESSRSISEAPAAPDSARRSRRSVTFSHHGAERTLNASQDCRP
jgi:cell division protein FtsZ